MKKNKRAIALRYDGSSPPKVTAKGEGYLAKKIIEVAKEHHIPIEKNEILTALLAKVRLDDEIPTELYVAVAQILGFLYHLNDKKSDSDQE